MEKTKLSCGIKNFAMRTKITLKLKILLLVFFSGLMILSSALFLQKNFKKIDQKNYNELLLLKNELLWNNFIDSEKNNMIPHFKILTRNRELKEALQKSDQEGIYQSLQASFTRLNAERILSQMFILNAHGEYLSGFPEKKQGQTSNPLALESIKKQLVVSGLSLLEDGQIFIVISTPIYYQKQLVGVGLFTKKLEDSMYQFSRQNYSEVFIYDGYSRLITGTKEALPDFLKKNILTGEKTSDVSIVHNGQRVYLLARHTLRNPFGKKLGSFVIKRDITQKYLEEKFVFWKFVLFFLGFIALLLVGVYVILVRFFYPFYQAIGVIKKISKGQETLKPSLEESTDEVGQLGVAFNEMVNKLKNSTTSVENLNEEIEQRNRVEQKLQKALKEAENIQFALDEHSIVAVTDQRGDITYVNDKFCVVSGYSREELLGKNHRIVKSDEHSKEFYRDMWRTVAQGRVWKGEVKNKKKCGGYYWVDASIIPILDEKGKPCQYIAVRTEITKSKDMAKMLIKEKEKAQQATKSKSNFLANMSHEIRTPMNSILGFADLLNKTELTDIQKKHVQTILSGGQLLLDIIDDILNYSKMEAGKIELESINFELRHFIKDSFGMVVSKMAEKHLDTYMDIDEDVPSFIKGDPTRLKQIFINLLGNAIKFTGEGEIGVLVSLDKNNPSEKLNEVCLRFCIKDSGVGMTKEQSKNIFQPFTQADETTTRKFGGTGLGLAISQFLVRAMQGEIWVKSEKGKGSEFIFTAIFEKSQSSKGNSNLLKAEKSLKGRRVLILDDNKISCKILSKGCNSVGMEVVGVFLNGKALLENLDDMKTKELPELILCDIHMDSMDGYEVAKKIRSNQKYKDIKILAVTSDIEAELDKDVGEKNFDGYLSKPASRNDMIRSIAKLLLVGWKESGVKKVKHENKQDCRGITVLVADDSLPNRMLIQAYFDELGCLGDYATNGKEAVDKMKNNKYDLCLMDLQMPEMGGIEATKIIREQISKDFPIIALTAAVLKEDRERAEAAGMNDFLTKPINVEELKSKIIEYGQKFKKADEG